VNVTISGFTIRGGADGIYLQQSSGNIKNCTLQNNVNRGLYAAANALAIITSVVSKANAYGMAFSANATGGIYTSTLTQNTGDGLIVNYNAHAKLLTFTVSYNQNGVSVFRESSVYLVGTKVSYNKVRGAEHFQPRRRRPLGRQYRFV
jgi:parallel beta-helix repeat protein